MRKCDCKDCLAETALRAVYFVCVAAFVVGLIALGYLCLF